jgi:hypothetical protein
MQTNNPSAFELNAGGTFVHGILVACLFVPGKGFFLGTSPGTGGFYFDTGNAPTWWHQVQGRQVLAAGRANGMQKM